MGLQLPEDVKKELAALGIDLTRPRPSECLFCYLWRMVEFHGCDGLFWAKRYQELCAPKDKTLAQWLEGHGGYCDCAVTMNVVVPHYPAWGPGADYGFNGDGFGDCPV